MYIMNRLECLKRRMIVIVRARRGIQSELQNLYFLKNNLELVLSLRRMSVPYLLLAFFGLKNLDEEHLSSVEEELCQIKEQIQVLEYGLCTVFKQISKLVSDIKKEKALPHRRIEKRKIRTSRIWRHHVV